MSVCASCGKQIEAGTVSCSSCGHPVSLDPQSNTNPDISSDSSDARDVATDQRVAVKRGLRWGPICIVASFIAIITFAGLAFIGVIVAISGNNDTIVALVQVGIALICSLLGGWIVGNRVGYRGALHGLLSALIAGVVLATIMLIGMLNTRVSASWIVFGVIAELLILPGFGALGGFLGERLRNRKPHSLGH
ncbi:MAG: TIGR04086 family membrane protein [Chloroflexota bacterium]|nr:TIGR04086 family membrane protein [Chloroflexota bacterium]